MLEEALKDPSRHPAEAAQAMRMFISQDLPSGGASAEQRFFKLFSLLCTRVFGEMQDAKGEFKHEPGGWLSAQTRWRPTPAAASSSSSSMQYQTHGMSRAVPGSRPAAPSIETDPVVQLLGPMKALPKKPGAKNTNDTHFRSLIEALTVEVENRPGVLYPFPFLALPESMQRQFMLVLQAVVVGASNNPHQQQMNLMMGMNVDQNKEQVSLSPNAYRLFNGLLRMNPEGQHQVRAYQQQKLQQKNQAQPLQLSPGLASPQSLAPISPTMTSPKPEQKESTPNLILSMLEYYLFLFIRYSLASPFIPRQTQSQAGINRYPMNRPLGTPYGEIIYSNLFTRYLRHFLPHTIYPTVEAEFPTEKAESEFFLRVVIAFWLESHVTIPTTSKAVQAIRERFQRTGIQQAPSVDLRMSYDLAFGKYFPLPTMAQRCLRSLIIHLVLDPTIYHSVMDQNSSARTWCLSQAMTALQQPFYNYVRSSFRHASIHAQGSAFYTAMNAWLMWLEPWNVNQASKATTASKRLINSIPGTTAQTSSSPTLTIPKADKKSGYTKSWEPFLAANLFLYTVPLAIFLRRARELDFSPREFNRSMEVVKRVFRVYTPEVINALANLTAAINNPPPGSPTAGFSKTVENHRAVLGEFAPSTMGDLSLSSCQRDMQGLLEEIHMQHMKRVRDLGYLDRFAAFLEGLFGHGVVSGEEIAIKALVERAKVIVGFPIGYELLSTDASGQSSGKKASGTAATSTELRTSQGILTDEGRQQLLAGRYKCNPADIHYLGDKMQARLRSHEVALLVTLTTHLSNWLNMKFGLLAPESGEKSEPTKNQERFQKNLNEQDTIRGWRINLRWFADYRNLMFTVVLTLLMFTVVL